MGWPGSLHSRGEMGWRMAGLLVQTEDPFEQGAVRQLVEGPVSLLWDTGNLRTESSGVRRMVSWFGPTCQAGLCRMPSVASLYQEAPGR